MSYRIGVIDEAQLREIAEPLKKVWLWRILTKEVKITRWLATST